MELRTALKNERLNISEVAEIQPWPVPQSPAFSTAAWNDWIVDGLEELRKEYSRPDWDALGAEPLSSATVQNAYSLLIELGSVSSKDRIPSPELGVDVDGDIVFDWFGENCQNLSVSISATGSLVYVGYVNGREVHDTISINGALPEVLLKHLATLFGGNLAFIRSSRHSSTGTLPL